MGKGTRRGLIPPDDPIFSTGPEISSNPVSRKSSRDSAGDTAGEAPVRFDTTYAANALETEQDAKRAEVQRHFKMRQQDDGILGQSPPTPTGAPKK